MHIGSAPSQINNMLEHPVLRTLLCANCRDFYGDGKFEQGNVILCSGSLCELTKKNTLSSKNYLKFVSTIRSKRYQFTIYLKFYCFNIFLK